MHVNASDNSHMPSLPTSSECFHWLDFYHQINQHFAFCGRRTLQMTLWCINIRSKFLGQKIRPPATTMHYNELRDTMQNFTRKLQKPSMKTFTWTITSDVLGLKWNRFSEVLVVSSGTSCSITKSIMQRLVLSLVSKVSDPIGPVAPFTFAERLLLKTSAVSQDNNGIKNSNKTLFTDFWCAVRTYRSLNTSKSPDVSLVEHLIKLNSIISVPSYSCEPEQKLPRFRKKQSLQRRARGANESNDRPKIRTASSSICHSIEKGNYTSAYCNIDNSSMD